MSAESLDFTFRRRPASRPTSVRTGPPTTGWLAGILADDRRQRERRAREQVAPPQALGPDPHREPSVELTQAWEPVRQELMLAVDESAYRIWLAELHPHRLKAGVWVLAHRQFAVSWVRDRFGRVIEGCAGRPFVLVTCGGER